MGSVERRADPDEAQRSSERCAPTLPRPQVDDHPTTLEGFAQRPHSGCLFLGGHEFHGRRGDVGSPRSRTAISGHRTENRGYVHRVNYECIL